ncbi:MAG: biotin/lipoyl-binding protein [Cyanobacteria bacterium NC_groundwater_1444_Ag_S-0.65um_54_12]|nr:biotin/lipoyl-binding protein [Cyanobacteria bacterium NC_groundwater_1444_Ag_S-0.65um_54_12]
MQKVLIANRGEIALRVIRACQELGLQTVAVYTEADRAARHLTLADQAYNLGSDGYLAIHKLLDTAAKTGADAIHPGYGFLAESVTFAEACLTRGLTWIGPNPRAIALMGSKIEARRTAKAAGVPIVPGTMEDCCDPAAAMDFANEFGWPLAVKAAAGGGGKGFVVVNRPDEIVAALAKARREGEAYFASGTVYLEKYLPSPRHIEIQILADKHGKVVHLGERECSIQRRHQKLVEECPSPVIDAVLREEMGNAAICLAQAVAYDSAGTVEFLFSEGRFYFLEMNTRIQVEHTITELVYGCDLVKEQIRSAAGEPLRLDLTERKPVGWAIECRINAEDPSQNFRPAPGLISLYRKPGGPGVRIDDAIYTGYRIPEQYDSLLAKLIAWGENRPEAIARMQRALREIVLEGVPTTIPFHQLVLAHPSFQSGDLSTHFIGQEIRAADLAALQRPLADPGAKLAGNDLLSTELPPSSEGPGQFRAFEVEVNNQRYAVRIAEVGAAETAGPLLRPRRPQSSGRHVAVRDAGSRGGAIKAPMHATVQRVLVEIGQRVELGQILLVLEAMKMETEIPAPCAGILQELTVVAGQTVEGDAVICVVQTNTEA